MSLLPATTEGIATAVGHLRTGGVLGLPTETVYGLAADATNPAAVARVFATKCRPSTHPLIVHLAVGAPVAPWVADWPITAERLAAAFWPGPLTLVVPRSSSVLPAVTGRQDTVALRVPAHPVAQAVLAAFGGALVAPSANRYGRLSPTRAADVVQEFAGTVPVVEGGECTVGIESTIVACLNGEVRVLRPGLITPGALSRAAGVEVLVGAAANGPRVPGAVKAHYAPRTPLEVVPSALLAQRAAEVPGACVVARVAPVAHVAAGIAVELCAADRWVVLADTPAEFGQRLYATLRDLDALGAPRLLVEEPPAGDEWAAVRDRLTRAAAAGELEGAD
jgi:L-threonylcarbamoyladenylate synthase